MARSLVPQRWHTLVPRDLRNRLRRAILLCSIVTVLVLIGDHTIAGTLGHAVVHVPPLTSTLQPNFALFTSIAVSVHESIGSLSERSFEVASLIVLGLSLLGGGRALTRTRQTRRPRHDAVSQAAGPTEVVGVARQAHARVAVSLPQSGAR
jgi:hypothetical protein